MADWTFMDTKMDGLVAVKLQYIIIIRVFSHLYCFTQSWVVAPFPLSVGFSQVVGVFLGKTGWEQACIDNPILPRGEERVREWRRWWRGSPSGVLIYPSFSFTPLSALSLRLIYPSFSISHFLLYRTLLDLPLCVHPPFSSSSASSHSLSHLISLCGHSVFCSICYYPSISWAYPLSCRMYPLTLSVHPSIQKVNPSQCLTLGLRWLKSFLIINIPGAPSFYLTLLFLVLFSHKIPSLSFHVSSHCCASRLSPSVFFRNSFCFISFEPFKKTKQCLFPLHTYVNLLLSSALVFCPILFFFPPFFV